MSYNTERAAIESRFTTAWADATKIKYENVTFVQPKNVDYVAITIKNGRGSQDSLGETSLNRYPGMIAIQIFSPEGTGTASAKILEAAAGAIFNRAEFTTTDSDVITCDVPSIIGGGTKDGWYQLNVRIPFRRSTFETRNIT